MKIKIDIETVKDYAIYAMLVMIFLSMVASCLMLIKTQDVTWYGITVVTNIIGIVAGSWKFKEVIDEKDISECDVTDEEQA